MSSYLHAWWFGTTATNPSETSPTCPEASSSQPSTSPSPVSQVEPPVAVSISTPDGTLETTEESTDADEDVPPAFPSLDSIQRSSASRAMAAASSDAALMPPPPLPTVTGPTPRASSTSSLRAIQTNIVSSPSSSQRSTSSTLKIPSVSGKSSNTLQLPPSTTRPPAASSKKRGKVALAPGHSALDWAALKVSGQDLRGTPGLMRITPSQLKLHNKRDDAWSSFNGKVYNITPYLSFHPGGEKELMRVAGRDGTKLFGLTHAWVNVEFMLDECLVGFLVSEPSSDA